MQKQILLDGETILMQSNDSSIFLTNQRLLKNSGSFGNHHFMSMHLQNISATELSTKSAIWLLALGILFAVLGLSSSATTHRDEGWIAGLLIGVPLVVVYFFTIRHTATVVSDGGTKLNFTLSGMSRESALDFLKNVDQAKSAVEK